ncbi:MAG: PEP-utilizing enzyme, partial [Candidatus Micrarchaeota archaeon]
PVPKAVNGLCGSPGKVVGKVKVVRAMGLEEMEADFAKFEEGGILVTPQTQPNMVILMKKAGGIVTDEGGITCHAAVVSRELGVPCIVGTHKATKTFKNGDFVELDATKGVARLIKRKTK